MAAVSVSRSQSRSRSGILSNQEKGSCESFLLSGNQKLLFAAAVAAGIVLAIFLLLSYSVAEAPSPDASPEESQGSDTTTMKLWSSAFSNGQPIPSVYTRTDGKNLSPPLEWSGVPADDLTQSLALIVDDPDAPDPAHPQRTWVHWVLYNIPPTMTRLEQGAGTTTTTTKNDIVGIAANNDWKQPQYDGPDPPVGSHRYFFKLYALDTMMLDQDLVTDKASFWKAAEGHIVRFAELVGTYEKQ